MLKLYVSIIFTILLSMMSVSSYALPPNSHAVAGGWACNTGFKRQGQQCNKIFIPPNAVLKGQGWICRTGYIRIGQQCNVSKTAPKTNSFGKLLEQLNENKAAKEKQLKTAITLYRKKNFKAALNLFAPLAKQGNARAKFYLGLMYANGQGVLRDDRKAAEWTFAAAKQGYTGAQFNLGTIYRTGKGVAKDPKKSVYWYAKAAGKGHIRATYYVGLSYYLGEGVLKDEQRGLNFMRQSAMKGDADSQYILGLSYCTGTAVIESKKQCAIWIKRAFDGGHPKAASIWEKYQLWNYK